jgi:site-specific recombinase XerD
MLIKRGKVWHSRIMFDGTLHQKSLRTHNRANAVKLEAVLRTGLIKGEFGIIDAGKAPTLTQFEVRLLPHLEANVAPRTYGFYKQNLAVLKRFSPLALSRLHKIDASMIEKFIQHRLQDKVTPVTVNHSLRTLRRVLHIARDWKLIREVPKIKLLPGEHERDYVLDDETVNRGVEYLRATYPTSRMHLMLPFLVDTGLRITEACGLQKEHIQFRDELPCSIRIVKGKSKYAKREIPLTERAALTLAGSLEYSRCAYAFTSQGGRKPITRHYPSEQFRAMRTALGLEPDCVLHSTRHTFCTRLGKAGADAFTIQRLAGHSSITISQRYVHADREIKESAIRLLDVLNRPSARNEPK